MKVKFPENPVASGFPVTWSSAWGEFLGFRNLGYIEPKEAWRVKGGENPLGLETGGCSHAALFLRSTPILDTAKERDLLANVLYF